MAMLWAGGFLVDLLREDGIEDHLRFLRDPKLINEGAALQESTVEEVEEVFVVPADVYAFGIHMGQVYKTARGHPSKQIAPNEELQAHAIERLQVKVGAKQGTQGRDF